MAQFVELHWEDSGEPLLLDVNAIEYVFYNREIGKTILSLKSTDNSWLEIKESYEEVKEMIKGSSR